MEYERRVPVIRVVHFEERVVVRPGGLPGIVLVFEDGDEVAERRCHCRQSQKIGVLMSFFFSFSIPKTCWLDWGRTYGGGEIPSSENHLRRVRAALEACPRRGCSRSGGMYWDLGGGG